MAETLLTILSVVLILIAAAAGIIYRILHVSNKRGHAIRKKMVICLIVAWTTGALSLIIIYSTTFN